jgi:hypothetical protein
MFFVRSHVSGKWSTVDVHDLNGNKYGEKILVRVVHENGRWSVDHRPVEVEPGLCVSFLNHGDADWFMQQGRAEMFGVEPNTIVAFALELDAQHFVRTGQGVMLSTREVEEMMAELQAAHAAQIGTASETETYGEDDHMQKIKGMENKAVKSAPETKKAGSAKPAKGSKKGGK